MDSINNQLVALDEIVDLAFEDPLIRAILASCNLNRLITNYDEPDHIMSAVKALGAIEFSDVHRIWSETLSCRYVGRFRTRRVSPKFSKERLKALEEEVYETITYVINIIVIK